MAALSACADPPTVTPSPGTVEANAAPTIDPNAKGVHVQVLSTELSLGFGRIGFRITDEAGVAVKQGNVQVAFVTTNATTGKRKDIANGPSVYFGAGLPDGGEWVVYTDLDSSGTWVMDVTLVDDAGKTSYGRANVEVIGRTKSPRIGLMAPDFQTPKLAPGADAKTLTSTANPDPDLYKMSVPEAAASKKPTVVYFGSDAYCPTPVCKATLVEVTAVKNNPQFKDKVNFIHVESHDLANPTKLSAAAQAWALPTEPWTFVLNKRGAVSVRIEGGIDRGELGLLLQRELAGP